MNSTADEIVRAVENATRLAHNSGLTPMHALHEIALSPREVLDSDLRSLYPIYLDLIVTTIKAEWARLDLGLPEET